MLTVRDVHTICKYSKQGYEISVVGESENTARYAGINVGKVIIRTMILSGALCGLTGFLIVGGRASGHFHRYGRRQRLHCYHCRVAGQV